MREDGMAEVALVDVSKSFGAVEAVRNLSLSIANGEFVVLLGPTGAGKTTTLRLIAGLERPDRGQVLIHGRNVTDEVPAERDVAFVFQQYSLYPHLTVYDNLAFPLRSPARRMNEQLVRRRIQQVAELLHIEHKLGNRATALSGGEMQRVAIGRALVREPAVYLMDEPLSSLDAKLRAELRLELKRIQRELGTTILYVTHDQIEAMTMADRIGVMNEGVLIQLGTPREIYERPDNASVARRVSESAEELSDLDRAIGDGDHGANMRRGFEAVLASVDELSAKNLGESLKGVGTTLVMKVGGASGPLYGTLFMSLGKSLADDVTQEQIAEAFAAAIEAVKARGKSDVGQKTMLDVLFPVLGVLRESGAGLPLRLKATAREAAERTVPMRAIRGRASFLGDRSIGHMDPGARSSELIVDAVADVMEGFA